MQLDDVTAERHEKAHAGHLIAYAASHYTADVWRLSIVRDGETGHYPISEDYFMGTQQQAHTEAARLNAMRLKLPSSYVTAIIAQSMRGTGDRRRRRN